MTGQTIGIIGLVVAVVCAFTTYNLLRKLEAYEAVIEDQEAAIAAFLEQTSMVLHAMRAVDEKQMFEQDDEVGTVFQQLVDIIGTLRPLIYGIPDEEKQAQ